MTTERNAQGVDGLAEVMGLPERLRSRAGASDLFGHHSAEWCNGVRFAANEIEAALRSHGEAIRELVEADRLLDKTQAAYDRASAGRMRNDLWADVLAARQRRAAALAKFPEPRP